MGPYHSPNQLYNSKTVPQGMIEALERIHNEGFNSALESVYIYDLVERQTLWASNSVPAMLGYGVDDTQLMGHLGMVNLIHPEDLPIVLEHYQKFDTLKSGSVITVEYRMQRADGTWSRLRSQETPLTIAVSGLPIQILGILQEVVQNTPNDGKRGMVVDQSDYDVN